MKILLPLALVVVFVAGYLPAAENTPLPQLLKSRKAEDRKEAAKILAERPGTQSVRLLLELLEDDDRDVRKAARRGLAGRRAAEDRGEIAGSGLSHRHPRVRAGALEVLAAARAKVLAPHLPELLEDRDPGIRETAVGATVNVLGGRGQSLLAAAVSRGKEGRPRAAALLALRDLDPPKARALARELLGHEAMESRVAAVEVLGPSDLDVAVAALRDPSWSVRLTAIRLLADAREPAAIPPLIGALGRERGRLRVEASDALCRATGVGLPANPDRWRKWWEEEREGFEFPERGGGAYRVGESTGVTFHSIPVVSEHVAFVLDRSRSMRDRIEREEAKTKGELVEEELARTLSRLKSPARFFLVGFATEPKRFYCRPVKCTPSARRRATDWFGKLPAEGRSNLYDALVLALAREDVDTIFLLSDGAPSAGEEQTRSGVLAGIARWNRYRKAVIHTVEIGAERTGKRWRGFLADLAERNGGRYVER